jgi:hypothetical protein
MTLPQADSSTRTILHIWVRMALQLATIFLFIAKTTPLWAMIPLGISHGKNYSMPLQQ